MADAESLTAMLSRERWRVSVRCETAVFPGLLRSYPTYVNTSVRYPRRVFFFAPPRFAVERPARSLGRGSLVDYRVRGLRAMFVAVGRAWGGPAVGLLYGSYCTADRFLSFVFFPEAVFSFSPSFPSELFVSTGPFLPENGRHCEGAVGAGVQPERGACKRVFKTAWSG